MAFEINITVNAPDLTAAMNNLANTLVSMMMAGAEAPRETAKEIKTALAPENAAKIEKALTPEPKPEAPVMEMPAPVEAPAEDTEKAKRAELKKLMAAAVRAGKNAEASALIHEMGYKKISEVPADKLDEAIKKAGEL